MASASAAGTAFLPDHKWLGDAELLAPPAYGPFTALAPFTCTYVAKLDNIHVNFVELTRRMCEAPHGCLLAINSNFGHAAQPGYERYVKAPKPAPERRVPTRGRPRKVQGDGTCFNSAIEPVIAVDHPEIADDKVYFVKCFPSTGVTQVPGTILPDLSDGHAALEAFVAYLNELGVGDEEAGAEPRRRRAITIAHEQPNMINYKFRLIRSSPRVLVNLYALAAYLCVLEHTKATEAAELTPAQAARFAGWPAVVLPPFPVRETKSPTDDVKVSFRFKEATCAPRLNVFQAGKINILGANSAESAGRIYDFFARLFTANWAMLVTLQPRRDLERHMALRPAPRAAALRRAPPPARLTDAEVDHLLADLLGDLDAGAALGASGGLGASGDLDACGAGAALDAAVSDIVADLDEWEFGDEEDAGGPAQNGWPAALQDVVLGEVDREDVEDHQEDPL